MNPILLAVAMAPATVTVDATEHGLRSVFRPAVAIGGSVDGTPSGTTRAVYQGPVLEKLLDAGLGALSYRLNSELGVQAWHWNPRGRWSDTDGSRGYFVGTKDLNEPIEESFVFDLPRNGFSHDQGPNHSYSRLTDGDPNSLWKSNPYLSSRYLGEPDAEHPQWVVIDLGSQKPVNAISIHWGDPYAPAFDTTYWTGVDPFYGAGQGRWESFPGGRKMLAGGHDVLLRLCTNPVPVRYVRVSMSRSSHTSPPGSADPRDREGFAIREIGIGTVDKGGAFTDLAIHDKDRQKQTTTMVSSVDPWHESADVAGGIEQPGLDVAVGGPLSRNLPAIVPVAMLYSTPEDAANEVAYLRARRYPIAGIELGEEPDGQFMTPEDYGALYVLFARAIRKAVPGVPLVGPCLESDDLVQAWPNTKGESDWLGRFVSYLRKRHAMGLLQALTMEHYPLGAEQCTWYSLLGEPRRVEATARRVASYGLKIPLIETECNMSWDANDAYLSTLSAAWEADYIGAFLSNGGRAAFLYEYEPLPLQRGPTGWGTYSMFIGDAALKPRTPTPEFFATKMVTGEWCGDRDGLHRLYATTCDLSPLVTAYAVQRPDDRWGVLLVNKDAAPRSIRVVIRDGATTRGLHGTVTQHTLDSTMYTWHSNEANGEADPAGPYTSAEIAADDETAYTLPPRSVVVLRGE